MLGSALALLGGAMPAFAEETTEENTIAEIVVTAQRREENLQKVPISMSAFNGETLKEQGVTRASDLTSLVPNLGVFTIFGDAQQPSFSIRGIGLFSFSDSFEPPVGMYVDEVYKASGVGQAALLFDVERVEVLRGPQGTLFGRNTTGGLFNITTRKPTVQSEFSGQVQLSSYNDIVVEAAGGGPLSDTARVRLAARYNTNDGWSKGLDGRRYDDTDTFAARASADLDLGDSVNTLLTASYSRADQNTPGFGVTGYLDPTTGQLCAIDRIRAGGCVSPSLGGLSGQDLGGFRPGRTPGKTASSFGLQPRQFVKATGVSSRVKVEISDTVSLTSVTAYEKVSKYYFEDLVLFSGGFTMNDKTFTQELRLDGGSERATWVAGLYYFNDVKRLGSFDPNPDTGFVSSANQKTESWAVFGQTAYELFPELSLTAGLRYTNEDKSIHYTTDFGLDAQRSNSEGQLTGRIGLDYQVNSELMVYGSASSGYKSGGFNGQFVFSEAALDPVESETLISYEAGLKADFWGGRARLNAAVFHYDYRDIQLGIYVRLPTGGFATLLRNAGDVSVSGAEIDLAVNPTTNLRLTGGIGLLDSKFQDSNSVNNSGVIYDLKGKSLPLSFPISFNVSARYGLELAGGDGWLRVDYSWKPDHYFSTDNSKREGGEAYGLLNLRAGWDAPEGGLGVEVFVDNATNQRYLTFAADQTQDFGVFTWGRPRWAGVALKVRY
jgi:iron complex outermembrane receptor protein